MTNFEKAVELNESFGVKKGHHVFPDLVKLKSQVSMIEEECVGELLPHINEWLELSGRPAAPIDKKRCMDEVRDGIADTLVVIYGLAHVLGFDADKDFQAVHNANMSKICKTHDEAIKTQEFYSNLEVTSTITEMPNGTFVVKSSQSQTDKRGIFFPDQKFLKNINWQEPMFD